MAIYNITSQQLKGQGVLNSFEIPGSGAFPNQYSIDLDGTDDEAIATLDTNVIRGTRTVSFWMKLDAYDTREMIMSIRSGASSDAFSVLKATNGNIGFQSRTGASNRGRFTDMSKWDAETTLTNWTHILVTKEYQGYPNFGTIIKIFINGVDVTNASESGTINAGLDNEIRIGSIGNITYYGSHLNGKIDELAVFTGHLTSSANIDAIYNSGVPGDLTDLNPLVWYRMGDIVAGSGSNVPDQGSLAQGDLVLQHDTQFVEDVPS
tara:strand:- start:107 stop:898 length:792 start_codon:yes stop_codon:yes gene_type:complete